MKEPKRYLKNAREILGKAFAEDKRYAPLCQHG
jgi:hypothetical protein